jgi:hypothetical protein
MDKEMTVGWKHPLVQFGVRRGWSQARTAEHFGIGYAAFRGYVNGWAGVSYRKAESWMRRAEGEFTAVEIMDWHAEHRRVRPSHRHGRAA